MDDQSSRCEVAKEGWPTLKGQECGCQQIDDLIAKISQPRPIIEKSQEQKTWLRY